MPSITPAINGVVNLAAVNFQTDLPGSVSWTASAGTPTSGSGSSFFWGASIPGLATVRITATNGTITLVRDIVIVRFVFVEKASEVKEGSFREFVLSHRMENGQMRGRRKTPPKLTYEVSFRNRTKIELDTVRNLYKSVGLLEPFGMASPDDPGSSFLTSTWLFDSPPVWSRTPGAGCKFNYSFRVIEA